MKYNVKITLTTTENGRGCRVFNKEIEAPDETQAEDWVRLMFDGFLADQVSVETKVIGRVI